MLVDKTMTFNKGTLYILESGVVRFVLKYLCIKFRSAAVVTNWLVDHRRMLKCFRKLHLKFQEQISHVLLQNYVTNSCMVWYSIWCTLIIDDTRRQPSLCLSSSGSKLTCFTYLSIAIDICFSVFLNILLLCLHPCFPLCLPVCIPPYLLLGLSPCILCSIGLLYLFICLPPYVSFALLYISYSAILHISLISAVLYVSFTAFPYLSCSALLYIPFSAYLYNILICIPLYLILCILPYLLLCIPPYLLLCRPLCLLVFIPYPYTALHPSISPSMPSSRSPSLHSSISSFLHSSMSSSLPSSISLLHSFILLCRPQYLSFALPYISFFAFFYNLLLCIPLYIHSLNSSIFPSLPSSIISSAFLYISVAAFLHITICL